MTEHAAVDVVGRGAELALLGGAVAGVVAGRGGAVLIQGEPGIGKSALLDAAVAGLDGSGCEVLRGACDELGQRFPLSVMTHTLGVDRASGDPRRARVAASLIPTDEASGWSVRVVNGDPVTAAVEQLLELVDRLCAAGPVLLAVEDLHWADEASLLLWRRLCRASVQLPLLVIGTCRPVPRPAELDRLRQDLRQYDGLLIPLGPLAGTGVLSLAARLAGGEPGPRLAERLQHAAGNPLYVRELLDSLARTGALSQAGGVVDLADVPAADGTVSLAGVIAERLDFLSADTRQVLRIAALLGPEFSAADLALIAQHLPGSPAGAVEEAVAAGVLEPVGASLRFRHGLLKESLYETMPTALRAALHRHAAELLIASGAPVERIAELILPVLDLVDGWELDWLVQNAAGLSARAPAVAAELLEHALQHTAVDDPRSALLEDQLAAVCFLLRRSEQTERISRGTLARTTDPQRIGQAEWFLGYTLLIQGRWEEAAERVGGTLADARVGPVWRARLAALQSMVLPRLERVAEATEAAGRALAEGELLGDATAMAYALHSLSFISHAGGDWELSVAQIDRALAVTADEPGLADLHLLLLGNRAAGAEGLGRLGESLEWLRQARELAERTGTPRLSMIRIKAAELAFDGGRWDEATAELDAITELPDQVGHPLHQGGMLALIAVRRGDFEQAERQLAALKDQVVVPSVVSEAIYLMAARALAEERADRPQQAVAELAPLVTQEFGENLPSRSEWLPGLVRLALAADDRPTAEQAADAARRDAEQLPLPLKLASEQWCRGLLDGDPAAVLHSVDFLRSAELRMHLGNALEDAAALQAGAGEPDAARETLAEAVAVYSERDALWEARRATARLRALGVRLGVRGPRQRPRTGWAALTAAERGVAELVARGQANPEIAAQLKLSRRTVETHVSHILEKLRIRSRRDVAELAPARPAAAATASQPQ